jgi:hypothetical protein
LRSGVAPSTTDMVLNFEQHVYLDVYNEGEQCLAGLINDGMSSGAFLLLFFACCLFIMPTLACL